MTDDWPNPTLILHALHHLRIPDNQSDVEKYIGGPDGDVESAMKRVQDALACVSLLTFI